MKSFLLSIITALTLTACTVETKETPIDLKAKAKELSQKFIITDGHVDLPFRLQIQMFRFQKIMEDVSQRTEKGNFDYVRAKEGGLDAPFMSIYVPSSYQENGRAKILADSLIDMVVDLTKKHPDKFALANTPDEVRANFEQGLISLPMGMENGAPILDDLANVAYFYERGIRYITLTHGKDNQICDSSYDTTYTWNGLSPFGEEVVREMNRIGIMVDVSHISDSTFYDVMAITEAPVIASHSSLRHFVPDFERNMTDQMIVDLAKNGGVIQINFGSTFIDGESRKRFNKIAEYRSQYMKEHNLSWGDSALTAHMEEYVKQHDAFSNVKRVADHIDRVVALAGVDHVGFGSDFDGVGDTLPEGLKDVADFPNLIEELLRRGYSEEDIEKICYKNVFRVWEAVANIAREKQKMAAL